MRMVPIVFSWQEVEIIDSDSGEMHKVLAMLPLERYANLAARQFEKGEIYPLVVLEARSRASHNQYFAALSDGFDNLQNDAEGMAMLAERLNLKIKLPPLGFVDVEHYRKWALAECGFCKSMDFNFATKQEAMRLARFYREEDSYAYISVAGTHVTIKIADSQSAAAMQKQKFEDSKRAVLDLLESMIGLRKGQLMKNAGKSA